MNRDIYGVSILIPLVFVLSIGSPLPHNSSSGGSQINSNSILVALLESRYTELAELVEKALLLQTLEEAVGNHNVTIFAPNNEALERLIDPEFKRFLLEPGNVKSLQTLLLSHIIPTRIEASSWPGRSHHRTLSNHQLALSAHNGKITVGSASVTKPDDVTRPDGVIHGIERLIIPLTVQEDFNKRRSLTSISAVLPEGAPEVDPRTNRLKKTAPPSSPGSPPALPIAYALAPGPAIAPAPAPGPGGPHKHFNGEKQVKDFIHTLLHYGGYNELADILVNLTTVATEMGHLVSEGYRLTVLAPNDEAMAKLTTTQLSEIGAPEQIVYYHIIPEYQTEESMYNAARRFGKVKYDTLRFPHKVVAQEADGSVKFGTGDSTGYLIDPDIYTDGRISVQGVDGVLFPETNVEKEPSAVNVKIAAVKPARRGRMMEIACGVVGTYLGSCQ